MKWLSRWLVFLSLLALLGCTEQEQRFLQTQAASLQKTALAGGGEALKTEAAKARQTGEAFVKTQAANVQSTLESSTAATQVAALATQLAELGQLPGAYQVGAYFYPWYGPGDHKWNEGYAGPPELGLYDSSDPTVIQQQIDWAAEHGVDFFAVSWWGPGSAEDIVLRDAFLKNQSVEKIRFAILYESPGRLVRDVDGKYDLGSAANRQILLRDFAYLQTTYWNNDRYLKLDGKPAIFFYLSREFKGDLAGAFSALREAARQKGNDLYLIGDEVYWNIWYPADGQRLKLFDAVTAYNMHASTEGIADNFTAKVKQEYLLWREQARQAGAGFIPGIIPGFDDSYVRPQDNHPPIPRSEALFQDQLNMAMELVDPDLKLFMITSWNEWLEDTSIEPGQPFGQLYLDLLQNRLSQK